MLASHASEDYSAFVTWGATTTALPDTHDISWLTSYHQCTCRQCNTMFFILPECLMGITGQKMQLLGTPYLFIFHLHKGKLNKIRGYLKAHPWRKSCILRCTGQCRGLCLKVLPSSPIPTSTPFHYFHWTLPGLKLSWCQLCFHSSLKPLDCNWGEQLCRITWTGWRSGLTRTL